MSSVEIKRADDKRSFDYCMAIRILVFAGEQGYLLYDLYNELGAAEEGWENYLVWQDEKTPVATARWKMTDKETAKIGYVAVLKKYRGQGHGEAIVTHITDTLSRRSEIKKIQISSQDNTISFYEKNGYNVVGEGYFEGHIPHHKVEMILDERAA